MITQVSLLQDSMVMSQFCIFDAIEIFRVVCDHDAESVFLYKCLCQMQELQTSY